MIKDLKSSNTGETINPNIVSENIPSGAVTTPKINDGSVTTDKIANGSVTYEKLATALKNLIDGKASSSDLTIVQNALTSHTSNTSNPHSVTKAQVGLGNADNTSDANKPISNATQQALNGKASLSGNNNFSGQNTFSGGSRSVRLEAPSDLYFTDSEKDFEDYMGEKQDELISGTNIKTINNTSLLGSGNIDISGGSQLYMHQLRVYMSDGTNEVQVGLNLISSKSTAITLNDLKTNYENFIFQTINDNGGDDSSTYSGHSGQAISINFHSNYIDGYMLYVDSNNLPVQNYEFVYDNADTDIEIVDNRILPLF